MQKKYTIVYSLPLIPVEASVGVDPRSRVAIVHVSAESYDQAVREGISLVYAEKAFDLESDNIVPIAAFHGHLDDMEDGLSPYKTDRRFAELASEFLGKMRAGYEIGYGFDQNNIMRRPRFMMRENDKIVHSLIAPDGFKSYDLLPWPLRKLVDEYTQFNSQVETPLVGAPLGVMIIKNDGMTDEEALASLKMSARALERQQNVTGEFDWDAVEKFERSGLNFLRIIGEVIALGEPDDGFEGTVSPKTE